MGRPVLAHWLPMGHLGVTHGFIVYWPMGRYGSAIDHARFWSTGPWVAHGSPKNNPRVSCARTWYTVLVTHKLDCSQDLPWVTHALNIFPIGRRRVSYVLLVPPHGLPIGHPWLPTGRPRVSHGFAVLADRSAISTCHQPMGPRVTHGSPTGLSWVCREYPVGLPWAFHGTPMKRP